MGINSYRVFTIHCNTCNSVLDDNQFNPIQEDSRVNIIEVARGKDWEVKGVKCICSKCLTKLNERKE